MASTTTTFNSGGNTDQLLVSNRNWAQSIKTYFPSLFPALAIAQSPKILWIGCSDSRVPESSLLGLLPGEVFVHRNVANLYNYKDPSLAAALHYAVEEVKVTHVIICGHIGCGGVKAVLSTDPVKVPEIDNWLTPLRGIKQDHLKALGAMAAADAAAALAKYNVQRSLVKLAAIPAVANAITVRPMTLQGAIYDVGTGLLTYIDPADHEPAVETPSYCTMWSNVTNKAGGTGVYFDLNNDRYAEMVAQDGGWDNEHWGFIAIGDGSWALQTLGTVSVGTILGLDAGSNNIHMQANDMYNQSMQRWTITTTEDGSSVFIANVGLPGYQLDIDAANGWAPIMKPTDPTAAGQHWIIMPKKPVVS